MPDLSRRTFLSTGAGAGVAAVAVSALPGIVTVAPSASTAADAVSKELPAAIDELSAAGPLVVHIRDAASGQVAVLQGETEVVFSDHSFISRVVAAATGQ